MHLPKWSDIIVPDLSPKKKKIVITLPSCSPPSLLLPPRHIPWSSSLSPTNCSPSCWLAPKTSTRLRAKDGKHQWRLQIPLPWIERNKNYESTPCISPTPPNTSSANLRPLKNKTNDQNYNFNRQHTSSRVKFLYNVRWIKSLKFQRHRPHYTKGCTYTRSKHNEMDYWNMLPAYTGGKCINANCNYARTPGIHTVA